MSEVPPPIPPEQPPSYAEYHRPEVGANPTMPFNGSSAHLKDLMDAYFGLNWTFLGCVLIYIVVVIFMVAAMGASGMMSTGEPTNEQSGQFLIVMAAAFLLGAGLTFACAYKPMAALARAKSWNQWIALILFVIGVGTIGIIAFVVAQMMALEDIKKYGLKAGCSGIRKRTVQARVDELRAQGL